MPENQTRMRRDIAAFLPGAMHTALQSYIAFSQEQATQPDSPSSKTFKDHHDACKVAIAHIKLLIELAKWADLPPPELQDEVEQQQLMAIIQSGQAELDQKHGRTDDL